ncbi:hypothetical protein CRP4_gp52 [Roseobacter phage CRP-4]|uniref:DUF7483 domain-containing protein n=1 Tax=Roseobacter phage CRP-4 TaxID=2559283 RepID=A0A646QW83_9CAUD|nr:hypothetical protein CRP4_gp52 [Roseobacter phage CRP-4]
MATKKKMLQAAAGQAGGAGLDITEVFSTYLYEGNGSIQTITNDIDLAGEGGLVWIKGRSGTGRNHHLVDTERGASDGVSARTLQTNSTNPALVYNDVQLFKTDGFRIGGTDGVSANGEDFASWTFRKAPKFFDVVTYTGDGVAGRAIPHSLGSTPGVIIVKNLSNPNDWMVYHTSLGAGKALRLNLTNAVETAPWFPSAPTTTDFYVENYQGINQTGYTYVAYLFAHNDGDGGFGPDGDQDIIKCGSYTNSSSGIEVDLGFEPQWLLVKKSNATGNWAIIDTMRGWENTGAAGDNSSQLRPNLSNAENREYHPTITPTGFKTYGEGGGGGSSVGTFIYMAIRRGSLAQPESGTEVFDVQFNGGNDPSKAPVYQSGFVTDMSIVGLRTGGSVNYPYTGNRLMGIQTLETHTTDAEESGGASFQWDFMNGFIDGVPSVITDTQIAWMWKRAPGFFDVVAYTGTNVPGLTINHNLGVVPEMIWVKNRSAAEYWAVYHKDLNGGTNPSHYYLKLNDTIAETDYNEIWNDTEPTATQFTVGQQGVVNGFEQNHIAYLFATVAGVSKVGSFTGNGGSQTIDCGFTSGARFVLIKRASASSNWLVFDTERGIVSGTDPYLFLDITDAENAYGAFDEIDPHPSGFTFNYNPAGFALNGTGAELIFYAIA